MGQPLPGKKPVYILLIPFYLRETSTHANDMTSQTLKETRRMSNGRYQQRQISYVILFHDRYRSSQHPDDSTHFLRILFIHAPTFIIKSSTTSSTNLLLCAFAIY